MTTVNGQQSTDFVQRIQKAIFKLEGRFFCVNKTTSQRVNKLIQLLIVNYKLLILQHLSLPFEDRYCCSVTDV